MVTRSWVAVTARHDPSHITGEIGAWPTGGASNVTRCSRSAPTGDLAPVDLRRTIVTSELGLGSDQLVLEVQTQVASAEVAVGSRIHLARLRSSRQGSTGFKTPGRSWPVRIGSLPPHNGTDRAAVEPPSTGATSLLAVDRP